MRVEILPPPMRFSPEQCMSIALEAFKLRKRYPHASDIAMWVWLLRWAGAPE